MEEKSHTLSLDECIKRCEMIADKNDKQASWFWGKEGNPDYEKCVECASEHRQIANYLKELKKYSLTEERPHGKWVEGQIKTDEGSLIPFIACDQCRTFYPYKDITESHNYCPNCGADMRKIIINNGDDLYKYVIDDYNKHSTELTSLHFDIDVIMKKSEILKTYRRIQKNVNGDEVCRITSDGNETNDLIPEGEYEELYMGNCMKFLKSFNDNNLFVRYCYGNRNEPVPFIL